MDERGPEPGFDPNACPRCGLPFAEEGVDNIWVCNRCRRKESAICEIGRLPGPGGPAAEAATSHYGGI